MMDSEKIKKRADERARMAHESIVSIGKILNDMMKNGSAEHKDEYMRALLDTAALLEILMAKKAVNQYTIQNTLQRPDTIVSFYGHCPECDNIVGFYSSNYCSKCGQRLTFFGEDFDPATERGEEG